MDQVLAEAPGAYVFPPFRLHPARRLLEMDGAPVSLSGRAFDLLLVLIEARDRVLSRADIMALVWAGVVVEDHNLSVQMHGLRRALRDSGPEPRFIATVPGRGYRFIAPISFAPEQLLPGPPVVPLEAAAAQPPSEQATSVEPPSLEIARDAPLAAGLAAGRRGRAIGASAVALVVVAVLAGWFVRSGHAGPPRLSLVVMPFRNLSDDGARPYLADAVSGDLATDLARIPGSIVIDSESAGVYKGKPVAAAEIGRVLNVRYLVRGSLRAEGAVLHINAELVDTGSGKQVWGDAFDTGLGQLADMRTAIVARIASALGVKLVEIESARAAATPPAREDALDLLLQARATMASRDTLEGFTHAQQMLEGALKLQPDYDEALGALSLLLVAKVEGFDDPEEDADFREAKATIRKALDRDPHNERALVAQGRILSEDGRNDEALAAFEMVLQRNPNNVAALYGVANDRWRQGQPAAVAAPLQQALRIDPVGASRPYWLMLLGAADVVSGRAEEAEHYLGEAVAGETGATAAGADLGRAEFCRLFLIAAAWERGDAERARTLYADYARVWRHRSAWRIAGYFTEAQRNMAGFAGFVHALTASGMPAFLDEHVAFGVEAPGKPVVGGDFDPTPLILPGGGTIDAAGLRARLGLGEAGGEAGREAGGVNGAGAVVLDVGRGIAAPAGAIVPMRTEPDADPIETALRAGFLPAPRSLAVPLVVMGDGVTGWRSYDAALGLIDRGYRNVLWYRGGEESWAHNASQQERRDDGRNELDPGRKR